MESARKEKTMRLKWLDFFRNKENEETHENDQIKTLKEIIKSFISNFKHQTVQYKIVWSVRILCWILILAAAIFGVFVRTVKYFK